MKARDVVGDYIEHYGIDEYIDLTIHETELNVEVIRKSKHKYSLDDESELIKLKAILTLMEIDFGLID